MLIIRKQDRIDYLVKGVSDYFQTSKEELVSRRRKPILHDRKRLLVKILYEIGDCSYKDIRYEFNLKNEAAIWMLHSGINADMSGNTSYGKELNKTYNLILKHLNL
jgi:chromosomal replication initiation ATPase DnaA